MKRKSMTQEDNNDGLYDKAKRINMNKNKNPSLNGFVNSKSKTTNNIALSEKTKNQKSIEEEVREQRILAEQAVMNKNLFNEPKKTYIPKTVIKENFSTIIFPLFINSKLGGIKEKLSTSSNYTQLTLDSKDHKSNDCLYLQYESANIG
jgi:hypothetical protein